MTPARRCEIRPTHPRTRGIPPRIHRHHRPPPLAVDVRHPRPSRTSPRHLAAFQPQVLVRVDAELGGHGGRAVSEGWVPVERIPQSVGEFSRGIVILRQRPFKVDRQRFHNLLQYLTQLRLTLVYKSPLMHARIVPYNVIRVIPRNAMREPLSRPLVIHDGKRRDPTPQRIVVAYLVGLVAARVDLVGDEEGVFGEPSADASVAVLVGAVSGGEDYGAVGGRGLKDRAGADVGIAVEEEEDASGGRLDYSSTRPILIRHLLRQHMHRALRGFCSRGTTTTTITPATTAVRTVRPTLHRRGRTLVDHERPPLGTPLIPRSIHGLYAILPRCSRVRCKSLEGQLPNVRRLFFGIDIALLSATADVPGGATPAIITATNAHILQLETRASTPLVILELQTNLFHSRSIIAHERSERLMGADGRVLRWKGRSDDGRVFVSFLFTWVYGSLIGGGGGCGG
mmetsp:Transcript_1163/g.2541  ORF Transcript_1163/g.2541 Transcript_1163/m.2541 type:complete len:455 (-) Transcript_1163:45-1409(-)